MGDATTDEQNSQVVGIAVTAATIGDPIALVARLLGDLPILLVLAMIVIVIARLSTNMAANVVSPSHDFSNLSPRQVFVALARRRLILPDVPSGAPGTRATGDGVRGLTTALAPKAEQAPTAAPPVRLAKR